MPKRLHCAGCVRGEQRRSGWQHGGFVEVSRLHLGVHRQAIEERVHPPLLRERHRHRAQLEPERVSPNLGAEPPVSTLSPEAQVSVLTCSPGSELYSIFGHSALRIQDPATRLDWVWNYGVFEFDTPNFVLKFARGKLLYYVLSYNYRHFYKEYLNE